MNFLTRMNIPIYSYQNFDTNEYPNKYSNRKYSNIRIYSYQNFNTNEYPNKYSDQKYSNIRIYSSHSGQDWHQFCAFTIYIAFLIIDIKKISMCLKKKKFNLKFTKFMKILLINFSAKKV